MSTDQGGPGTATPTPDEIEHLVRALVGMMRTGGVTELDVEFGQVSVRLRGGGSGVVAHGDAPLQIADVELAMPVGHLVTAPMVGTFYTAPNPGASAFVRVGDTISAGSVIGIIEAMKIMNEITADRGGVVDEILATNAQAVEYGSPLVRLRAGS